MNAYTPVISHNEKNGSDCYLVDMSELKTKMGSAKTVQIIQTLIYAEPWVNWQIILEDEEEQIILIEHFAKTYHDWPFDLIKEIGHALTLLPTQKLKFHTDGKLMPNITYVLLLE